MRAVLTIVSGEGTPKTCEIDPQRPITVGRSRDNVMVLHDERASRQHAHIYFEHGQWFLRDNGTLNGTHVGATRIEAPLALHDGLEFDIADLRLRFNVVGSDFRLPPPPAAGTVSESSDESCLTPWHADELMVLHNFMTQSAEVNEPREVIMLALKTLLRHTMASVTGFLSLDPNNNPLPRVILPELARVDICLSRQMIQRVQQVGKTAWLAALRPGDLDESESLMPFTDAICVPLKAEGAPFATLHVYRSKAPFTDRELRFTEMVASYLANLLGRLRKFRSLEAENSQLRRNAKVSEELIGASQPIQALKQMIVRAAACSSTVLIHGETGAGKELVAKALHLQSDRNNSPFVVANCGAIVGSLLESELFGHCEGSFTGATKYYRGLFEQADEGTLFLDEVGDMSLDCQVKVLRAIEGKGFRPVGGTEDVHVNVRLIAASHKDLAKEVRAGRFRQDLFFRLRVIYMTVPPLREHIDDLPELVERFLAKFAAETGRRKQLSEAAMKRLAEYAWPGNVRELRTVLESAVMLTDSEEIDGDDLWLHGAVVTDQPMSLKLEDVEARAIREALKQTKNNVSAAARILGISREGLSQKIKKYGIAKNGEE
jgi:two-component system, NtrC family, response regulator HydG